MSTGSLVNNLYAQSQGPTPEVGMGATVLMWTDRWAATIVAVSPDGRRLQIQRDTATRTDTHGMSDAQAYTYQANPNASRDTYTLRKNGRWVRQGDTMQGGQQIKLGVRDEHYDYSF